MSQKTIMMTSGKITQVRLGRIETLAGVRRPTAYAKKPVSGPVAVHALGLDGDAQANRRVHGGPEKAVYGYPVSGYAAWQADFPALADRLVAGAMGENLVIAGGDEHDHCLGDIVRAGTAILQIAQIREPCSTFTATLGTARVAKAMTRSGRCGWYYRVIEGGMLAAGDAHDVIERPNPDWPISRFTPIAAGLSGRAEELDALSRLPGLTPAWQVRMAEALAAQSA